jgi:hypothetical protein
MFVITIDYAIIFINILHEHIGISFCVLYEYILYIQYCIWIITNVIATDNWPFPIVG